MSKAACLLLVALLLRDERVDAVLAKHVKDGEPGAAVLVIRNGKVLLKKGYGLANVEHAVSIRPGPRSCG